MDTKANRGNLYAELLGKDIIGRIRPAAKKYGYIMRVSDGRFVPKIPARAIDNPWVYVCKNPGARCDIFQTIFFDCIKHIHSFCRDCYKVVVRPRNIVELFDLYELQKELNLPAKCGTEWRKTVGGLYGGYFYCRGLEQGRERYKIVREAVDEGIPVILKRYCTEFEIGRGSFGPSDKIPPATEEEILREKVIEDMFPQVEDQLPQTEMHIAYIMRNWIEFAFRNGDEHYRELTGGRSLVGDYVTYEKEDE